MQRVVERIINLLIFLLEAGHPVTADEVRYTVAGYGDQSDDAFHRMFERDKDVLRRLGVPLSLEPLDAWEVDFGYKVDPEEYALSDPGLTDEERAALALATQMVRLGGGEAGVEAMVKLGGAARVIGVTPFGADLGVEAEVLGVLLAAVTERRKVSFDYHDERRELDPYGLAHRRGHWYLAGKGPEGERVFRVDRLSGLEVGEGRSAFKRPARYDMRKVMSTDPWATGQGPEMKARIRFDADIAWWVGRSLGVQWKDGEPLEVELPVTNGDALAGWVLSFGAQAELLSPPELRDEIRARVRAADRGTR